MVERIPGVMEHGKSMMVGVIKSHYAAITTSDVSVERGVAVPSHRGVRGEWFQLVWLDSWRELHITIQELLPIVLGVALWGRPVA